MNIMMKTLLSTVAFVGFVSIAHADNGPNRHHRCNFNELCTSADIPVELAVDPGCELTVDTSAITLTDPNNTGTATQSRNFNVKANYAYKIKVDTDHHASDTTTNLTFGSDTVLTTVSTSGGLSALGQIYNKSMPSAAGDDYTATFTTAEDFSTKPVGTYTDTYHIYIYF
ncbi:hypothetical protein [Acinetobacter sp. MB5]|uniref:hypothetical protein n=1 Tax=Acinetobacter sp. MB5 TaxID=2069438 RepID=UPI0013A68F38|nr:hypothetical protein [Acinetobacter sp. MB5]